MIAFGPVPSRRLGRSIGVNHIPPKTCPYACVYCQVGGTSQMTLDRQAFYSVDKIVADVSACMEEAVGKGESVDYVTFVPDGEPTLDVRLGEMIRSVGALGPKTAVISNASLIWREDVREELALADWVSLKVDAVDAEAWHAIDRPHGRLELGRIAEGRVAFAEHYEGQLVTETMLVRDVNDSPAHLRGVAEHLACLQPSVAYLAVPTRPPAESWVRAPSEETLHAAYHVLSQRLPKVEYLVSYEGAAFAPSDDVAQGLLSITAVHPMRQDALDAYVARSGAEMTIVDDLIHRGMVQRLAYEGETYYVRRFGRGKGSSV